MAMKVFISYRRADSQATAGRLAQFLDLAKVGEVFLDADDIPLGEDFLARIQQQVQRASHIFVLIGPQWRGGPGHAPGLPRLFDEDDVVHLETRLALASGARVVPILLDGTPMPKAQELPADLKALPLRNAFMLRSAQFDEDMDNLLDVLVAGKKGRGSRWINPGLPPALRALSGLAVAGLGLLLVALANHLLSGECGDLVCRLRTSLHMADDDAIFLLWLLVALSLGAGALAPWLWARRRR